MWRIHSIRATWRVLAAALLVVGCLVGPASPLSALAIASSACATTCPCEHGDVRNRPDVHACSGDLACNDEAPAEAEASASGVCENDAPSECPDGCSSCACCPGTMAGVLSVAVTVVVSCTSADLVSVQHAPASPAPLGIFKPPRSLA